MNTPKRRKLTDDEKKQLLDYWTEIERQRYPHATITVDVDEETRDDGTPSIWITREQKPSSPLSERGE